MIRGTMVCLMLLLCSLMVQAETISISGIVKKTGTSEGITGAKVTLAKISSISAITDAEGKFTMSARTGVQFLQKKNPTFNFVLKGRYITFSPMSIDASGSMDIFSGNGKKIFSIDIASFRNNRHTVALPELSSGINLMRLTIDGKFFSCKLVSVGTELYIDDGLAGMKTTGKFSITRQAVVPVVDTLVVSKTGYSTKTISLDSYTKLNMTVEMDSSNATESKCTRTSLQELVNGYITALEAADPSKITLADNAKYTENMKSSTWETGIWKTKIKVNFHRDFFDVDSCKMYTEIIDNLSSHPYNIGAQIRVVDGKITEISALVADSGDWLISKKSDMTTMYTISSKEAWTIIPENKRDSRTTIKAAGDAYLDLFNDESVKVPWGTPCARLEGAAYTGNKNNLDDPNTSCNVGVPSGVKINNRVYVVDVEMGSVNIFCKFGGSMPDSHLFRVENGKLRFVHTISIQN